MATYCGIINVISLVSLFINYFYNQNQYYCRLINDLLFLKNNYLKNMMKRKKYLNISIYNIIVLSDSKIDKFTNALKTINLTQKAVEAANDLKMLLILLKIKVFFVELKKVLMLSKNY